MAQKPRRGGGKLSRSETVTVRLDPKLRYLAELGARKHRRTLSSFIEWATEESLDRIALREDVHDGPITIADEAESLWDVDESDRFAKRALRYPELLTHEEQTLWKLVRENGHLWRGHRTEPAGKWVWSIDERNLIYERLRENWDDFCAVADGTADASSLPGWLGDYSDDE